MDFKTFIAQCHVEWPIFSDNRKLALSEHPRNRRLAPLPKKIKGMATENKLMLLNLAVNNLAPGEVYVEIGCWEGLSLAGAAYENKGARIYACDNFSQFEGSNHVLEQTIRDYTAKGQVQFYNMDYLSFLDLAPWQPARIGTYFYDGGHSFEEQYQALERVVPWLADNAVVIIDDTNAGQVRTANRLITKKVSGLHLVTDVRTPGNESPTWWNGIQVYVYRPAGRDSELTQTGFDYRAWRFFWDDVMPPVRKFVQMNRTIAGKIPGLKPLYKSLRQHQL